jgi:hypothetical protein
VQETEYCTLGELTRTTDAELLAVKLRGTSLNDQEDPANPPSLRSLD